MKRVSWVDLIGVLLYRLYIMVWVGIVVGYVDFDYFGNLYFLFKY